MEEKRIEYIDCLKGLAILLVVMGHVSQYTFGINNVLFSRIYGSIHVPMFFFIGGYFANRVPADSIIKFIERKTIQLLLPTLFFASMMYLCKNNQINVYDAYWFLPVMFYCVVLTRLMQCMAKNRFWYSLFSMITIWGGMSMAYLVGLSMMPYSLNFIKSFPIFIMGFVFRQFEDELNCEVVYSCSIIAWVITLAVNNGFLNAWKIGGYFSCVFLYQVFKKYRNRIVGKKVLSLLGKNTLEIYVTHYFLLPSVNSKELSLLFTSGEFPTGNLIFLISATLILASLLCVACLTVSKIIKESKILACICYGKHIVEVVND